MPKRNEINEEQAAELERARAINNDKNVERRLLALLLRSKGMENSTVAVWTGFAETYVGALVSRYCKNGLAAIVENNYCGNRRNLSFEEEEALLKPFREKAEAGKIVEAGEIKLAYEEATGNTLGDNNKGQIYRVLKRHGWRKVMPRSKHPNKASDEVIETSKKLTKK